jgi:hypothetical protein
MDIVFLLFLDVSEHGRPIRCFGIGLHRRR